MIFIVVDCAVKLKRRHSLCCFRALPTDACNGDASLRETTLFGSTAVVSSSKCVVCFWRIQRKGNLLQHLFKQERNANIFEIF